MGKSDLVGNFMRFRTILVAFTVRNSIKIAFGYDFSKNAYWKMRKGLEKERKRSFLQAISLLFRHFQKKIRHFRCFSYIECKVAIKQLFT